MFVVVHTCTHHHRLGDDEKQDEDQHSSATVRSLIVRHFPSSTGQRLLIHLIRPTPVGACSLPVSSPCRSFRFSATSPEQVVFTYQHSQLVWSQQYAYFFSQLV